VSFVQPVAAESLWTNFFDFMTFLTIRRKKTRMVSKEIKNFLKIRAENIVCIIRTFVKRIWKNRGKIRANSAKNGA